MNPSTEQFSKIADKLRTLRALEDDRLKIDVRIANVKQAIRTHLAVMGYHKGPMPWRSVRTKPTAKIVPFPEQPAQTTEANQA